MAGSTTGSTTEELAQVVQLVVVVLLLPQVGLITEAFNKGLESDGSTELRFGSLPTNT